MSNSEKFTIDVTGETSTRPWKGLFETKLRLGHRDQFRMDEIRRELLGAKPESASPRAQNAAEVFSFLAVHLLSTPQWWSMNGNGLDLEDDNVVAAIYEKIVEAKVNAAKQLKDEGEAAKTELAKTGK